MQPSSSSFHLAPANTEQAYVEQRKIEALVSYVSAVRSNASGIPRSEMQPAIRRKNEAYLDSVPEHLSNSRRSGDFHPQSTVSFASVHNSSSREGSDPPSFWNTSSYGAYSSLVSKPALADTCHGSHFDQLPAPCSQPSPRDRPFT